MLDPSQQIAQVARELNLKPTQVEAVVRLLDDGSTIPFIARYRKEATGSLDEVALRRVRDRIQQLRELDKRREAILTSLRERKLLTDELKKKIEQAETLSVLEDIYLPFRPKRRTRATIAKEKGLEGLAKFLCQLTDKSPEEEARKFVDPKKKVESVEAALQGACDIIAEWVNERQEARERIRKLYFEKGVFHARLIRGKEEQGQNYKDYFDWKEPVQSAPSHRILASRRGEKEGILSLKIEVPEEEALALIEPLFIPPDRQASPSVAWVKRAVADGFKRLLSLSIETEVRWATKQRADREAVKVFSENLRQLLMAPPLGPRRILAVDPGYRTGCKVVCLDEHGRLLYHDTIYPFEQGPILEKSRISARHLIARFKIEFIAIGNGTASRETEQFFKSLDLAKDIPIVIVSETGASIYSASEVAREEFPDKDVTVRGAVSIGRRLMDPLAELVKIDPKSIGVGQYQHDVDQGLLRQSLDDVVISCVNQVGVELNYASPQLLMYVSGLGPTRARAIVAYREEHGPFRSRQQLYQVPRLGAKAVEQAAGFLRIRDGENPLDASAVHPERYDLVESMARDLQCSVLDLMRKPELRERIAIEKYVGNGIGLPTLQDILQELAKPGRDPRDEFRVVRFREDVQKPEDLAPGMKLDGVVTNITDFGIFVDIGVHLDGLCHISQMSDKYIRHPSDMVKVHQQIKVTVLEVDLNRRRIALSMKAHPEIVSRG